MHDLWLLYMLHGLNNIEITRARQHSSFVNQDAQNLIKRMIESNRITKYKFIQTEVLFA